MLLSALWLEEEQMKVKGLEMSSSVHWENKNLQVFSYCFSCVNLSYSKFIFLRLSKILGTTCQIIYAAWAFLHGEYSENIFCNWCISKNLPPVQYCYPAEVLHKSSQEKVINMLNKHPRCLQIKGNFLLYLITWSKPQTKKMLGDATSLSTYTAQEFKDHGFFFLYALKNCDCGDELSVLVKVIISPIIT